VRLRRRRRASSLRRRPVEKLRPVTRATRARRRGRELAAEILAGLALAASAAALSLALLGAA